jgi:hypothetical protein
MFALLPMAFRQESLTTGWVVVRHLPVQVVAARLPGDGRKLLYLATVDITRKWTSPIRDWAKVLNQLVIRFEDRLEF